MRIFEDVTKNLEGVDLTDERASRIAYMAEGNMRLALELVHESDNETYDFFKTGCVNALPIIFQSWFSWRKNSRKRAKVFKRSY